MTQNKKINIKAEVGQMAFQGDVMLICVGGLPNSGFVEAPTKNGNYIVTHSETGHDHLMVANQCVKMYEKEKQSSVEDGLLAYLEITGETAQELRHIKEVDTHETLCFEPGLWEIRRQREHSPEGIRQAID